MGGLKIERPLYTVVLLLVTTLYRGYAVQYDQKYLSLEVWTHLVLPFTKGHLAIVASFLAI